MKTIDLYMKRTERKEEKKFRLGLFFPRKCWFMNYIYSIHWTFGC
jgi:hypothetical protein